MSDKLPAGGNIGPYRILDTVGGGGMAVVYRAEDLRHQRQVAVKVLRPELAAMLGPERFLREISTTANLRHPHILPLYDSGKDEHTGAGALLYYVMPYVDGESLRDRLDREKQLPVDEALRMVREVADALTYAHGRGVVHRDIKPGNILLESGHAVVADFGIARAVDEAGGTRLTETGLAIGTPAYMSPEQAAGERDLDGRADLYSLGCVLYEALAGQPPFTGPTVESVVRQHLSAEPPLVTGLRPGVPEQTAAALRRALAKAPADRYRSVALFVEALRPDDAAPAITATRPRRYGSPWARRLRWAGAAAGLAVVTLLWRGGATVSDSLVAPRIAVLPFAPAAADSALERMGRDLAVTVTADLDGMGELHMVDALTTLAAVEARQAFSLEDAHRLARQLRADRFVHGALTRAGAGLRLDASLYRTGAAAPMARASATAADLPALTDSVTISLLDELWQYEPPAVASLAAVTKSAVPAARRAYLEGELALSRLQMQAAIDAFERAFAEDTTFWWAYWRSMYPRSYRETSAPDTALVRKVVANRSELPEADRLLIEASYVVSPRAERLARLEDLTQRFPRYEPGWWAYANMLVHSGGHHGRTAAETRAALERVLALNPGFVPAWDHLQWVLVLLRDSAGFALATREATRLVGEAGSRDPSSELRVARAQVFSAASSATALFPPDSVSRFVNQFFAGPAYIAEAAAFGPLTDGAAAIQIQLNRATRARAPTPALLALLLQGEALAWASRGAWDSAMGAADQWARTRGGANGELGAYRLAVAGVLLGALQGRDARDRRPRPGGDWSAVHRADLAWLDGVLAYLEQEPEGLASARRRLRGDSAVAAPFLERSLAALSLEAGGDRVGAARALAAVEEEIADRGLIFAVGRRHPTAAVTNRLLAARWFRSSGEDAEAARLLNWHNDATLVELDAWNRSLGWISLLDRAEIRLSAGDSLGAQADFTRFLRQYDLPVPALEPLIERARAGRRRLGEVSR